MKTTPVNFTLDVLKNSHYNIDKKYPRMSCIKSFSKEEDSLLLTGEVKSFLNREEALNHAKNMVVKALNSSNPYERGFLLKGNSIVGEMLGSPSRIELVEEVLKGVDTIIHGHPLGLPISPSDFIVMTDAGIKEIVAYNSKGEYSKLTKIEDIEQTEYMPSFITKLFKKFNNSRKINSFGKEYIRAMDEHFGVKKHKMNFMVTKELFGSSVSAPSRYEIFSFIVEYEKFKLLGVYDKDKIPKKLLNSFNRLVAQHKRNEKAFEPIIHEFWLQSANKFGVEYSTNYTGLKNLNK